MSTIQITGDAIPWSKRIRAAMDSPRLLKVMAAEGAKTVRQHFAELDKQRHRGGSHHYYAGAARATTHSVSGRDAHIVIDHVGISQRFHGGTIRPKKAKSLTIPVKDSAAEGRRASEFDDLFMVKRDGSGEYKGFLARMVGDEMEPLFWLRKSVEQKADPSVLPTDTELMDHMTTALNRELDRI